MSVGMNRQIQMIDLTQGDEPVITYVDNPRPPLAEMSSQPSSRRARASTKRRLTGVEQFSESVMNTMRQPPELVVANTSEATNISDRRRRKRNMPPANTLEFTYSTIPASLGSQNVGFQYRSGTKIPGSYIQHFSSGP